jgi:hypothetical protein
MRAAVRSGNIEDGSSAGITFKFGHQWYIHRTCHVVCGLIYRVRRPSTHHLGSSEKLYKLKIWRTVVVSRSS